MKIHPLSYYNERTTGIDTLVIHCLAFDMEKGINSFHENQVSSHYIIDFNGSICRLVDDHQRAWHAGKSFWRGREELNENSIGIEVCNATLGQSPYDKRQIFSLIRLCQRLVRRYHIQPQNVIGHSDIAPTRKADPGKCFPWRYLAKHGVGLWYNSKNAEKVQHDDTSELLAAIGYDTTNLNAAKTAFCRHFIPEMVPQEKDLDSLLKSPFSENFIIDDNVLLPVLKAVAWEYHYS